MSLGLNVRFGSMSLTEVGRGRGAPAVWLDLFEATGRVLVQQARDQRLVGQSFRQCSLLDCLKVLARQPDVQPPVLAERSRIVAGVTSSLAPAAAGGLPLRA